MSDRREAITASSAINSSPGSITGSTTEWPGCAEKARGELARDSHAAYVRGLLYGVGAAILGLILYATFAIVTGIVIGYVSLAVGRMVGKAIMKGSNGVGGRRYQITAVLLTYAAVSMAAIPIWIHMPANMRSSDSNRLSTSAWSSGNWSPVPGNRISSRPLSPPNLD